MIGRVANAAVCVAVVAGVLGACSGPYVPPPPPSDADARAYLQEVVSLARAGDAIGLCKRGGGNCARTLRDAGGIGSVPRLPPVVTDSVEIAPIPHGDGAWDAGGRVLFVCSVGADGTPVETDVLVFRDDQGALIAIDPVYWSGIQIAVSRETLPSRTPRPPCDP